MIKNNKIIDTVKSYFGLRSVSISKDNVLLLNDKPVFQRLVLDQGFYSDGIYTASTDQALKNDITISKGLGFNGARLHQKVFEKRFLYWADKLGYILWEEHANWVLDISTPNALKHFLPEWAEISNNIIDGFLITNGYALQGLPGGAFASAPPTGL